MKKILKKYDSSELIEKIKSYKKFSKNNPLTLRGRGFKSKHPGCLIYVTWGRRHFLAFFSTFL
jgi:hypothetical protein